MLFNNIVIIEDDRDDIELISDAISAINPHAAIRIIRDGREALAFLKQEPLPDADCILMDYNMPYHNGSEVLDFVKHHRDLAHIPVYMWTSADNDCFRKECMQKQASAFFHKPISGDGYEQIAALILGADMH
jgi:CheY-like chemotaxis protein